jgi:hypothetical protein
MRARSSEYMYVLVLCPRAQLKTRGFHLNTPGLRRRSVLNNSSWHARSFVVAPPQLSASHLRKQISRPSTRPSQTRYCLRNPSPTLRPARTYFTVQTRAIQVRVTPQYGRTRFQLPMHSPSIDICRTQQSNPPHSFSTLSSVSKAVQ